MSKLRFGNEEGSSSLVIEHENGAPALTVKSTDLIHKATIVTNRAALENRVGNVEGEAVWQTDIGLMYTWTDTQGVDNGGTIINVGTGSWIASYSGAVHAKWFTSLEQAISESNNEALYFDRDIDISAELSVVFVGSQEWIFKDNVNITNTSPTELVSMLTVDTDGNDFTIKGGLTLDGANKSRLGLRINNYQLDMDESTLSRVHIELKAKNFYSTTVGKSADGIVMAGGFSEIIADNCSIVNVSRATGVGISGSQGSAGFIVTHNTTSWSKKTVINNIYVENITNEEADASADNVDCDGVKVFSPSNVNAMMLINGGTYKNCKGRSIKSQVEVNVVNDPLFIRDKEKSIQNGVEVDFQINGGTVNNFACIYEQTATGGTVWGDSFRLFSVSTRDYSDSPSKLIIKNGQVTSNIDSSIDTIPYFITASNSATANIGFISGVGIAVTGCAVRRVLFSDLRYIKNISFKDSYFDRITTSVIHTTAHSSLINPIITVDTVTSLYTGTLPRIMDSSTSGHYPANGTGNTGFMSTSELNSTSTGDTAVLTNRVVPKDALFGGISVQSEIIANDATYVFEKTGNAVGKAMYIISNTYDRTAYALFGTSSGWCLDFSGGASTNVAYLNSAGDSPVDGKVNIWVDGDGRVNLLNKLGSSRAFNMLAI